MSVAEITVQGLTKTLNLIQIMKLKAADTTMKICQDGAKRIRKRARQLAPKKTGKLMVSIKMKKCRTKDGYYVKAYSYIAHFQEYGTRRGIKPKRFMHKAKKEIIPEVQKKLINAIGKVVDKD